MTASVFAYLRVSGRGQIHGDGFRRQFLAIRKYCSDNGLKIVRIFKERGVSGTKELDDRPALSELFNALEENGVKTIVTERLDRIARDLLIQEAIIADMQKHGYTLISTCEPDMCSEDPSRVLIRQILGAFAQYEAKMIVIKLRGARERAKLSRGGKCEGRHEYGRKPGEQGILTRMIGLQREYTCKQIAGILNDDKVPTRMGGPWKANVVAKILARTKQ